MILSKLTSRVGAALGLGCAIHCLFEYVCDFVICSGKFSLNNSLKISKLCSRLR